MIQFLPADFVGYLLLLLSTAARIPNKQMLPSAFRPMPGVLFILSTWKLSPLFRQVSLWGLFF
ncbi:hypothetical protein EAI89_01550 [Eubacterium sp. am_0171]|nr:hypothetical protein EAI89_01550 [Eubacterium sp. am_0171]